MANISKIQLPNGTIYDLRDDSKQEILISGTNIKTINNTSILGSGNIDISGGGGGSVTVDDALSPTSENPVQNKVINAALESKASIEIVRW